MIELKKEKLKRCPFCNGEPRPIKQEPNETYTIACMGCGAWASKFLNESNPLTLEQATEAWNRRTHEIVTLLDQKDAQIKALREENEQLKKDCKHYMQLGYA